MDVALLRRLPHELIDKIFAYIATPQSPALMTDIRSFYADRQRAYVLPAPVAFPSNLAREVFLFINRGYSIEYGFMHDIYDLWMRNFRLQTIADVDAHVNAVISKSPRTTFAMFWGMMTPRERAAFLKNIKP